MVQALQGEVVGSGGAVTVGRCRGRSVRHAVPAGQGGGVAAVAGKFGAELARALRASLLPAGRGTYGLRGPSELSWYAFATAYARDHWVGRAGTTWNGTRRCAG